MPALQTSLTALTQAISLASEPASILYIVTGAAGFAAAGLRKSARTTKPSSTFMLFCDKTSRNATKELDLF